MYEKLIITIIIILIPIKMHCTRQLRNIIFLFNKELLHTRRMVLWLDCILYSWPRTLKVYYHSTDFLPVSSRVHITHAQLHSPRRRIHIPTLFICSVFTDLFEIKSNICEQYRVSVTISLDDRARTHRSG